MQEASGADFTDLNRSAQPSSDDLATPPSYGPHSRSTVLLNSRFRILARRSTAVTRSAITRYSASRVSVAHRRDVSPGLLRACVGLCVPRVWMLGTGVGSELRAVLFRCRANRGVDRQRQRFSLPVYDV